MKKLIVAALAAAVLVAPAAVPDGAEANVPSRSAIADAKWMARGYWMSYRGFGAPCYGVGIRFERMPAGSGLFGYSYRYRCTIWLNTRVTWTWGKLCTTVMHEYGHLYGYGHTRKKGSVMYAWANGRFWYCD